MFVGENFHSRLVANMDQVIQLVQELLASAVHLQITIVHVTITLIHNLQELVAYIFALDEM